MSRREGRTGAAVLREVERERHAAGGGAEGVKLIAQKLGAELADTMKMCGSPDLASIGRENIFIPASGIL